MINNNDKTNKKIVTLFPIVKKQRKRKQIRFGLNRKKSLQPPIEFDKDLDYLVATRKTVLSVLEFVLRDE